MSATQICILLTISAYLLMTLWIGVNYSKKNISTDDFYLGGRKLGPLVTAMSAEASDMSSWLLMGLPGVAYLSGICDATWTAIGLAVGTYLNWLLVARKIRLYSQKINAVTVPDFFANRYHDHSKVLSSIAAVVIIVFFVPYTASGFAACGKLFRSLFGVDYLAAMIISAVVIVAYTTLGGFLAASTTDLIQSIVMTVALIVVITFGLQSAGGLEAVMDYAKSLPGYLSMNSSYQVSTGTASNYSLITIISTLSWGLGYFGMPHILLRFMAIEDEKKLSTSRRIASIWVVISLALGIFIGVIGLGMSHAGALETLVGSESETVIVKIASLISQHGILSSCLAGVILAGILAATMSTADSQLLAASSSVSQNLIRELFGIRLSEMASLNVARATVVVISAIAVYLARNPDSSVFAIVSFAWAGFGAAFGPVTLAALFWRRSTLQGAVAGMITGGVVVFVWKYLVRPLGGAWDIYELLPAFLASLVVIVIVSLCTKAPDQEILDEFDSAYQV